jgi:hypothetical protein
MTCQDVADHLGISWDTVRDIEKTRLERDFAKPPLKGVTHIAIDEIAVQKGHKYLTAVMDLKSGRVIFVGCATGATRRQGRRCVASVLETVATQPCEDHRGLHGHVAGLHEGGGNSFAGVVALVALCVSCVRPISRDETFQ